ncbi:MAG: hypothetical protein ACI8WT_001565 [Clostridium sp.]|jgi:hypothetical protein
MGFTKRMLEDNESRGFSSKDTYVCHECVGNYALKKHIKHIGVCKRCNYCGNNRVSVEIDDLMVIIISGIRFEYEDATGIMAYDKHEGGFFGATTWDNYDLIRDLNDEMQIESSNLLDDITEMMDDSITWCKKSPYASCENEEMLSLWDSFCEQVKYKSRYVFLQANSIRSNPYEKEPFEILKYIGESIGNLGLVKSIPKRTTFYRGRMHNSTEKLEDATTLGSPPSEFAKSNRMSPEGISMFYCANDINTALLEIYDRDKEIATVTEFYNMRNIMCVDFTKINYIKVPSLFDEQNRNKIEAIIFLKRFNENITRKIEKLKSVEYVPVQVVAEYFRHLFLSENNCKIDGIIYNSSIMNTGICYALFFNNKQCIYSKKRKEWEESCMLKIRKNSIKQYKPCTEWVINSEKNTSD